MNALTFDPSTSVLGSNLQAWHDMVAVAIIKQELIFGGKPVTISLNPNWKTGEDAGEATVVETFPSENNETEISGTRQQNEHVCQQNR